MTTPATHRAERIANLVGAGVLVGTALAAIGQTAARLAYSVFWG